MELCSEGELTVMAMLVLLCGIGSNSYCIEYTLYIYTVKEKGMRNIVGFVFTQLY